MDMMCEIECRYQRGESEYRRHRHTYHRTDDKELHYHIISQSIILL